MEWRIEDRPEAVIVELRTNPVNKQNIEFDADLHRAFDRLDREFPGKPTILTATGKTFSAGLDFDYVFPLFSGGDAAAVAAWFRDYRKLMLRVFESPRLTIAALNGHTFAGGMVLALCCDFRIAAAVDAKFALNEVPIGIPMPSIYNEIIRYRLGERAAQETILLGRWYGVEEARRLGFFSDVVPTEQLIPAALAIAGGITPDCYPAYACTKAALHQPVLERIRTMCPPLDERTLRVLTGPEAMAMHRRTLEKLKSKR